MDVSVVCSSASYNLRVCINKGGLSITSTLADLMLIKKTRTRVRQKVIFPLTVIMKGYSYLGGFTKRPTSIWNQRPPSTSIKRH